MIKNISIHGFRGFDQQQTAHFAVPDGRAGSGLTYIIGPNNSGKSTIIEAIKFFAKNQTPGISIGRRHKNVGKIEITVVLNTGRTVSLKTVASGGSETEFSPNRPDLVNKVYYLPSRRKFESFFSRSEQSRDQYLHQIENGIERNYTASHFTMRLFDINRRAPEKEAYTTVLKRLMGDENIQDWKIELSDQGQYFVNMQTCGVWHNSEGAGDGLISLLFIIDALELRDIGGVILIDEPELSLSPVVLRNLSDYICEKAGTAQVIITTHSPYLLDWGALENGGRICRVSKSGDGIRLNQPSTESISGVLPALRNLYNPHVLGIEAREILFAQDNLLLVEGQEDVIYLKKAVKDEGITTNVKFFGYGVGGKSSMIKFVRLFKGLGYSRIRCLFDSDADSEAREISGEFSDVKVFVSPLGDIRDKSAVSAREGKIGLMTSAGEIKPEHREFVRSIFID